jgi:hypothetical protein
VAVRSKNAGPEIVTGEIVTEPVVLAPEQIPSLAVHQGQGGLPFGFQLVWNVIRTFLFFTLRMLRPFLRIVMAIVSGMCLLMAITLMILSWFHGWSSSFLWGAAGFFLGAVISSGLTWYYAFFC